MNRRKTIEVASNGSSVYRLARRILMKEPAITLPFKTIIKLFKLTLELILPLGISNKCRS